MLTETPGESCEAREDGQQMQGVANKAHYVVFAQDPSPVSPECIQ